MLNRTQCSTNLELQSRWLLLDKEVQRLPHSAREIRVLDGKAWITFDRHDLIASKGDTIRVDDKKGLILISALNSAPLVAEIWGCHTT